MTRRIATTVAALLVAVPLTAQAQARRPFNLDDLGKAKSVGDPQVSPDGKWIAYTVGTLDVEKDKRDSDIWMVSWDGKETLQLTSSKDSESRPRWSPDGKYLAFTTSRGDEDEKKKGSQVWLLNRSGGEAQKLTDVKGGVDDFEWSPDSTRLVAGRQRLRPERGSREDRGLEEEDEAADRDRPLPVQARLRRLSGAPARSPLSLRRRHEEVRADHHRRFRRAKPVVVARRQADRLREQAAGRRSGSQPRQQHLRRRRESRRDTAAAHARTSARTAAGRRGVPTGPQSRTCRATKPSGTRTSRPSWRSFRRLAERHAC